jgi:hypothetical protein
MCHIRLALENVISMVSQEMRMRTLALVARQVNGAIRVDKSPDRIWDALSCQKHTVVVID